MKRLGELVLAIGIITADIGWIYSWDLTDSIDVSALFMSLVVLGQAALFALGVALIVGWRAGSKIIGVTLGLIAIYIIWGMTAALSGSIVLAWVVNAIFILLGLGILISRLRK